MTTLKENLNSQYFSAYSKLKPKKAPKQVIAYVESDEDIAFWRNILKDFESNEIQFFVQLPSNTTLSKGKTTALERNNDIFSLIPVNNLGEYLIICIDSDYDYLVDYSQFSTIINSNEYIFQTYSYSIENYKCFSNSLRNLCVTATCNDNNIIDLVELMRIYSQITYKLLLWNLYFYHIKDVNTFTLSNFCELIKILDDPKIDDLFENSFDVLRMKVHEKISELESSYPNLIVEVNKLGIKLLESGLSQDNAYLFIQGHTIFDNVVLMFLKSICRRLKVDHEQNIKSLAKHKIEIENNISHYHNYLKLNNIEGLLSNNFEFNNCFLFKRLETRIRNYMKKIKSA